MNKAYIKEYAENRNTLITYLRKVAPALAERLIAGFSVKTDGSLFKKDSDDLRAIIQKDKPEKITAFIDANQYSIWLQAKIHTPDGDHSVEYIDLPIYLWSAHPGVNDELPALEDLQLVTVDQLQQAARRLEEVQTEISALRSEEARIKCLLNK